MNQPLNGIRVVEMGQLIAIPYATKLLADMGAEVIHVEPCSRLENYRTLSFYENDPAGNAWNRAANFYEQNRNKLGVTLDLTAPEGRSILHEMIAVSDLFAENFTPRVMRRFGLEYEDLRRIKPDIIMVSSTGYGYTGPWSELGAIGFATEAASGLAHVTGYEDGPPVLPEIPYSDFTAAEHTLFAVMAALIHRASTGEGQFIDVSQTETLSSTIPETLMDYTVNDRTVPRIGNSDPEMSPHGCYPCKGEDRWIAIAVRTDDQWRALRDLLGDPVWAGDARLADAAGRSAERANLDLRLAEHTRRWDQHALMHALQERGVPAGAVLDGKHLLLDPHLNERRFYQTVTHSPVTNIPPLPYPGRPWRMEGATPAAKAAPTMGEDNHRVLCDLIGLTQTTLDELERKGVIGYGPTNPRIDPVMPLDVQKRRGRIFDYETDFHERVRMHTERLTRR